MPSQETVLVYIQFALRGLILLCCLVELALGIAFGIAFAAQGQSPQVSVLFPGCCGIVFSTTELFAVLSRFRASGEPPLLPIVAFIISDVLLGLCSVFGIIVLATGGTFPGIIVGECWVFLVLLLVIIFALAVDCAEYRR